MFVCVSFLRYDQTPLIAAIVRGSVDIVNILLDKGANPNPNTGSVSNQYTV